MIDDGGEVGWSVKLNRLEGLIIGFHHSIDTITVRVLRVAILQKKRNSEMLRSLFRANYKKKGLFGKLIEGF